MFSSSITPNAPAKTDPQRFSRGCTQSGPSTLRATGCALPNRGVPCADAPPLSHRRNAHVPSRCYQAQRLHGGRIMIVANAWRRLRPAPLFVFPTVATLAVALGAFAVVYTAVDKILIQP